MDLITTLIVILVVCFFLFTVCGWCCRPNKSETTFTTVTLPNATASEVPQHMAQRSNPPYPVQQSMMPQPGQSYTAPYPQMNHSYQPPQPGFVPYPTMNQPPYPPYQPGFSPAPAPGYAPYPGYPPVAGASLQQNPPTYDEATAAQYNKQAAYNPNFK